MNKKIGFIIGGGLVMFALVLLATDATLSTTRPQTEDIPDVVAKRNAMSTAGLYEALQGKGTNLVRVTIGGAAGTTVTTTNNDLTTLVEYFIKRGNTNGYPVSIYQINVRNTVVSTNVPTAQTNGASVAIWCDEYGRPYNKGHDITTDAMRTLEISPALAQFYPDPPWSAPVFNAATATTNNSEAVNVGKYYRHNYAVVATGTSPMNAQFYFQASLDGTNWIDVATNSITALSATSYKGNTAYDRNTYYTRVLVGYVTNITAYTVFEKHMH